VPDFIEKHIGVFDKIVKVFEEDVKGDLDHEAKDLAKRLERLLNQHAKTYGLETENDVNPIKYYSVKHRIKKPRSLKEKLVRKNDGFDIINESGINDINEIDAKKPAIIAQLKKVPDVIGIRIVTELRHDCNRVLALLRAFVDDLSAAEIVLDRADLDAQPQIMKNGLEIFKTKGLFRTNYGFELQIKSKIEEAWGDMDHAIFYKDYSVTPIKNITQVTMNNIGRLLEDIDRLLLGLRNSDSQYQKSLAQLTNLTQLNEELFPLFEQKLGVAFEIEKVASFLAVAKEKASEGVQNPAKLEALDCSFLDFPVNSPRLSLYMSVRRKSFELMVIEVAYFNWCLKNGKIVLTPDNYEENLNAYLDLLVSHLFSVIEQENSAQAAELENAAALSHKIEHYSKYIQNQEIYLSAKMLLLISTIEGSVEEFFQENQDAYFNGDQDYTEFKNSFRTVFVVETFGYDGDIAVDELIIQFNAHEQHLNVSLETMAYDFKEYQRKNERNARADQKKGEVVKESIPKVAIAENLVSTLKLKLHGE
jgi:ppGpp synthetase/RelA/SpoT-type nucleotidyltranferase